MKETTSENENRLITSLDELKRETCHLFKTAKKKIQIYSYNLDPRILNNSQIEAVIKEFIRSSRYVKLEILIYDERNMQNVDHRLVRLAQMFTSNIQIKIVPRDYLCYYLPNHPQIKKNQNQENEAIPGVKLLTRRT